MFIKKKKKSFSIAVIFAIASVCILSLNSCKKKENENTPPQMSGTLVFHLHTMVDNNEVKNYGDTLITSGGRRITVTTAQLYLSNIRLIKTDGTEIDGPAVNVLVKQGTQEYEIGQVQEGNYNSVRFDVGLSDQSNATVHTSTDQALNQPSMWFGTTPQPDGFVFVNFAGNIDTSNSANGTPLIPFVYKIGTTAHRATVTMPGKSFTITTGMKTSVHILINYAQLLDGIQLNVAGNLSITTVAQNSGTLANTIAAKLGYIFYYE